MVGQMTSCCGVDSSQRPNGTQWPPRPHSLSAVHSVTAVVLSHTVRKHGAPAPHSAWVVQTAGTPGFRSGKYWSPTPRPADAGSLTNASRAARIASHLLGPAVVGSSIDADLSSKTYMSSGTTSPCRTTSPQAEPPGSPEPIPMSTPPAPLVLPL